MKIRHGFVTNSSSSCFIIGKYTGKVDSIEQLRAILELLIQTHNKICGTNVKVDEICTITDSKDRDYINKLFEEQYYDGEQCTYCPLTDDEMDELDYPECSKCPKRSNKCGQSYTDLILFNRMAIFGNENSIPSSLFDAIKEYCGATRYHLG